MTWLYVILHFVALWPIPASWRWTRPHDRNMEEHIHMVRNMGVFPVPSEWEALRAMQAACDKSGLRSWIAVVCAILIMITEYTLLHTLWPA